MQSDELKRRISAGRGDALADLVLKMQESSMCLPMRSTPLILPSAETVLVGVGAYHGRKEVDLHGKICLPGPDRWAYPHRKLHALWSGFRAGSAAPRYHCGGHRPTRDLERCGAGRLGFYAGSDKNLTLSVYFMLPSCVPATDLDESGAVLNAEQLRPYYGDPRVLGLAELMNAYGTVRCDPKILQKIRDCTEAGKIVDGHAPLLSAKDLNAYIAAGVQSDHECSNIEEAMEKLRRGQYIMIREGTAAKIWRP